MKMKDAVTKMVNEFGTEAEREHLKEVIDIITKVFGNVDVAEGGLNKVMDVGKRLRKAGIQ